MEIINLAEEKVATVKIGEARIIKGTTCIVHNVNITLLQQSVESWASTQFPEDSIWTPLILDRINSINKGARDIQPLYLPKRIKRWDKLGTGWKWLAGSPDANDLRAITLAINNASDNNNKQIVINQDFESAINNITRNLNSLNQLNSLTLDKLNLDLQLLKVIFQLERLENQINQIQDSIIFSKLNVVNHHLLTSEETILISNYLKSQDISFSSLDQALEFTQINIAFQEGTLIYAINLPELTHEKFATLRVEPLAVHEKRIKLLGKVFMFNENTIYVQKKECRKVDKLWICKQEDLQEMKNDNCLHTIIKGLPSSCYYTQSSNKPKIVQMTPDVVLAMNVDTTFEASCNPVNRSLKGTYLITFTNCSVHLGHEEFRNDQLGTFNQVILPPTNGIQISKKKLIEEADLDVLHEVHINNLKTLEHLQGKTKIQNVKFWTMTAINSVVFLIILVVALQFRAKLSTEEIIRKIKGRVDQLTQMNPEVHQ